VIATTQISVQKCFYQSMKEASGFGFMNVYDDPSQLHNDSLHKAK